jgi:hypothetical protein
MVKVKTKKQFFLLVAFKVIIDFLSGLIFWGYVDTSYEGKKDGKKRKTNKT